MSAEAARLPELQSERDRLRTETDRLARGRREAEARADRCQQGGSQTAAQLERKLTELRRQLDERDDQLQVREETTRRRGWGSSAAADMESAVGG